MFNKRKRPRIGITGPDEGGWASWICTKYLVRWQGGAPVRITPHRRCAINELDGLILGGGADIDPRRYNEAIFPALRSESRNVRKGRWFQFLVSVGLWLLRRLFSVQFTTRKQDLERDTLEFGLLSEAVARQMPILGICRGGQLINVFFGGALYQDISSFYVEKPNLRTLRPRKLVHVESGSTLYRLLCRANVLVNSLHNQSVKTVGKGLRVSAREMNGVVQGIEHNELPFVVGVQWHPEFLPFRQDQRRIFHRLVESARVYQLRRQGSLPPRLDFLNLAKP